MLPQFCYVCCRRGRLARGPRESRPALLGLERNPGGNAKDPGVTGSWRHCIHLCPEGHLRLQRRAAYWHGCELATCKCQVRSLRNSNLWLDGPASACGAQWFISHSSPALGHRAGRRWWVEGAPAGQTMGSQPPAGLSSSGLGGSCLRGCSAPSDIPG